MGKLTIVITDNNNYNDYNEKESPVQVTLFYDVPFRTSHNENIFNSINKMFSLCDDIIGNIMRNITENQINKMETNTAQYSLKDMDNILRNADIVLDYVPGSMRNVYYTYLFDMMLGRGLLNWNYSYVYSVWKQKVLDEVVPAMSNYERYGGNFQNYALDVIFPSTEFIYDRAVEFRDAARYWISLLWDAIDEIRDDIADSSDTTDDIADELYDYIDQAVQNALGDWLSYWWSWLSGSFNPLKNEINGLKDEINTLKQEINTLKQEINTLNNLLYEPIKSFLALKENDRLRYNEELLRLKEVISDFLNLEESPIRDSILQNAHIIMKKEG